MGRWGDGNPPLTPPRRGIWGDGGMGISRHLETKIRVHSFRCVSLLQK
ncbi:MAG: hypothetical protein F6K48_06560 [Okeania sp. SIO3H1]|nr:hypothetical protein [Okeania sp. SIO3H1]